MNRDYLVIDAGNTNIEVGLYSCRGLITSWRLSSEITRTEDEIFSIISSLAFQKKLDLKNIGVCALASVVPELTRIFSHLFEKYFTAEVVIVDGNTDVGLTFLTEDHSFVGADLIVNAYSARTKHKDNIIICDFGTATTIQLIGSDGTFFGSVIAPGITTGSSHLFQKASLLSKIQLEVPQKTLGTNTKDSLLSGIVIGHCMMTDSLVRQIKKEYQHLGKFTVIATGGISHLLKQLLNEVDVIDKTLTIDGLFYYCKEKDRNSVLSVHKKIDKDIK